jgi:uncharacterized membrane protein AbrB (regulator of aidB expression)
MLRDITTIAINILAGWAIGGSISEIIIDPNPRHIAQGVVGIILGIAAFVLFIFYERHSTENG